MNPPVLLIFPVQKTVKMSRDQMVIGHQGEATRELGGYYK